MKMKPWMWWTICTMALLIILYMVTPVEARVAAWRDVAQTFTAIQTFSAGITGTNLITTEAGSTGGVHLPRGIYDYGPRAMVTITADCHATDTSCGTTLKTLAETYKIPVTAYVQRSPDLTESTNAAALLAMENSAYMEVQLHSVDHNGQRSGYSNGWAVVTAGNVVYGGMTGFGDPSWLDVGDVILFGSQDAIDPKRITVLTDATTLTMNNSANLLFSRAYNYYILDAFHTGTVTTDGVPAATQTVTLGGGGTWTTVANNGPSGQNPARGSYGAGGMIVIEGADENPYRIASFHADCATGTCTELTIVEEIDQDLNGVAYAIIDGPEALKGQVVGSRSEIRTDTGLSTLALEHYAAPNNYWSPWLAASARAAGLKSVRTGGTADAQRWTYLNGSFDSYNLNCNMTRGIDTPTDMIGWVKAAADSGNWIIFNLESVSDSKSDTGTIATNATTTVTGTSTTWVTDSVGANDWLVILDPSGTGDPASSRGYKIQAQAAEVITLTENLSTEDQNLTGKSYYIVDTTVRADSAQSSAKAVEELFSYINENRDTIIPLDISHALPRAQALSSNPAGTNLIANPNFHPCFEEAMTTDYATTRDKWCGWKGTTNTTSTNVLSTGDGIEFDHTGGVVDNEIAFKLFGIMPNKEYRLEAEIEIESITGVPDDLRLCIEDIYRDSGDLCAPRLRPEAADGSVVVGTYPVVLEFDTHPIKISAEVASNAAAGSYPSPASPKNMIELDAHGIGTGIYDFIVPPGGDTDGMDAMATSNDTGKFCVAADNGDRDIRVTCATVADPPVAADTNFTLFVPYRQFAPIGPNVPSVVLYFDGQGVVYFRGLRLVEQPVYMQR